MITNYILIGWRNLLKNRLFSFINIFGLALSMSVCMMVVLRIVDNFSYDNFNPAPDKTFRIISGITQKNTGDKADLATTPLPLASLLSQDTAIIREVVSLYPALRDRLSHGAAEFDINGAFTDAAFFRTFGFSLKYGEINSALREPFTIVLSEATSKKLFGDTDPVGKTLTCAKLGNFQITGVMATPGVKSHIGFEAYASASSVTALENDKRLLSKLEEWDTFEASYTYVRLEDDVAEHVLSAKLESIARELNKGDHSATISFAAQPVSSITPGWTALYHETSRGSSWSKLVAEVGIAMIILISACFNYTNLSIARALTRGKEVGIRKISGAVRWQIFAQYITESLLMAMFAFFLSQVFLAFILEYEPFNSGYEMVPALKPSFKVMLAFLAFTVFTGILAGALPAWILSAFKPVRVLRSMWSEKVMGNLSLRKGLMVFQFALSLVILIFLTAFYQQFEFMGSADAGFERKNILIIPFSGDPARLDAALEQVAFVGGLAHTSNHFGRNPSGNILLYESGSLENYHQLGYYHVDAEFIRMMKLQILEGENFSTSSSRGEERYILINEKAASLMGYQTAAEAVRQHYFLEDSTQVTIKGVIKDFYHRSVGHSIVPLAFRNRASGFKETLVSVHPAPPDQIEAGLQRAWSNVYPGEPFTATWLDERISEMNDPTADISLLGFLAFITVSIATMGLLGLVAYTVETKRKEISIRKIVGASVVQIVSLLSTGYAKLLFIAGLLALPLGYLLSQMFLMAFANRISFGTQSLLLSFLLLLFIGLVTIMSQTIHAASENPAHNLRSE